MKTVEIYTDGACSGNPGAGGWGAILIYNGNKKELSGFEEHTTNNRMELSAIIFALQALKVSCIVNLYSDSAYCVNAVNLGWMSKWQSNGWKKTPKSSTGVANPDLWQTLSELLEKHTVNFIKVKGHSDNECNNRCDELATGEIAKRSR